MAWLSFKTTLLFYMVGVKQKEFLNSVFIEYSKILFLIFKKLVFKILFFFFLRIDLALRDFF
ncbi:hypothetical protein, partial [Helicobacter pylori]|uniref:hypothetical protein n=1 Tax=Helicobacter pylori TaxID=210 RepID=UPI001C62954A